MIIYSARSAETDLVSLRYVHNYYFPLLLIVSGYYLNA